MPFLDINDQSKRAALVKEYVTAMKTVKQRNMVNREMKLAIGEEVQTFFHTIVNATKQAAAEETRKELALMKKTLMELWQLMVFEAPSKTSQSKNTDITFGLYRKQDGQRSMGNKVVRLDVNGKTLTVDDTEYTLTPSLFVLITRKHPRACQWNSNDYNRSLQS